jgi:hypothetical protein
MLLTISVAASVTSSWDPELANLTVCSTTNTPTVVVVAVAVPPGVGSGVETTVLVVTEVTDDDNDEALSEEVEVTEVSDVELTVEDTGCILKLTILRLPALKSLQYMVPPIMM